MTRYLFTHEFEVRDSECDMGMMVNNAVYQNYLEHARHVFLRQRGVDFAALAQSGVRLIVIRIEIDYLYPLTSGDRFWVGVNTERLSPLRLAFHQGIYRLPDHKPICRARVIGTAIDDRGRPGLPQEVADALLAPD